MKRNESGRFVGMPLHGLVIVGVCLILANSAAARETQQTVDDSTPADSAGETQRTVQVYALKHASAEQVASVLRALFQVVNQRTAYASFQFDRRSDSLIVTATPRHHNQIARIVFLLDRVGPTPVSHSKPRPWLDDGLELRDEPSGHVGGSHCWTLTEGGLAATAEVVRLSELYLTSE